MNDQLTIFNKDRIFFEEFLRRTNQKENINKFLIKNCLLGNKKIKILSIGAGSGEEVVSFLKYLKYKGIDFEFFYFDPSKLSLNLFKNRLKKSRLSKHISDIQYNKFEVFKTKEKFDIIIASHVFYYISDWEKSLLKLNKLLNDNGRGFIFLQSNDSDNFKFRDKFLKYVFGEGYNEKSGEELIIVIKKLSLDYHSQRIISTLNMTNTTLKNNKISLSGEKLLSFLLRTDYKTLYNDIKLKIEKYIKENSRIENKQRIFRLIDTGIILRK